MKKILLVILLSMMAIGLYAFSTEDIQTEQVQRLITMIESGDFETAERYLNDNNIESSVLSYYLTTSGVIPYTKAQMAAIHAQLSDIHSNTSKEYISKIYSDRLRFLLDNGASPMEFVFGADDPLTIVDVALINLLSENQGVSSSVDWIVWQQLNIIAEYFSSSFTTKKTFNFYFENFLRSYRCNYYIRGADSTLIPYIELMLKVSPIEPSENILSIFYGNNWFDFFYFYSDKWVDEGYDFSFRFVNSIVDSLLKIQLGDNRPRPKGVLPVLHRMGYDFSSDNYKLLFNSMKEGMPIADVEYIINETSSWNARNGNGETILMYASSFCPDTEYMEFLLNGGADINRIGGRARETALIFAVKNHAPLDNIKYLIEHGADIKLTDKDGNNVLLAMFAEKNPSSHIPFNEYWMGDNEFYNFVKGYMCPLISMLVENGADINAFNSFDQNIAIRIAIAKDNAYFNDYALFDLLYDLGLDFSAIRESKRYTLVNEQLENYFYDRDIEDFI